jgi:hypothetical protein
MVLSDPQGPYGHSVRPYGNETSAVGAANAPHVTVIVEGDVAPLVNKMRVMVDGVEQRVDRRLGRQAVTMARAPGGGRF